MVAPPMLPSREESRLPTPEAPAGIAKPATAGADPRGPAFQGAVDVRELADRVYQLMLDDLRTERDRRILR